MGAYEYIEFNSGILLKFIKKFLETALHLILPVIWIYMDDSVNCDPLI